MNLLKIQIGSEPELSEQLYSFTLFGSLVRGDYRPSISDIDFFAVFRDGNNPLDKLQILVTNAVRNIPIREVDIAWAFLEDVKDPLNRGYPFKFLTIYQQDFLKHHITVYGKDVASLIPRYDFKQLLPWAKKRLRGNLQSFRGNIKMLRITTGETVKLQAMKMGRGVSVKRKH